MTVESGFFSHYLAVAPDVNRRAVRAGNFAGNQPRPAQSTACARKRIFHSSLTSTFHFLVAINRGFSPELSYTFQASASGL